MRPAVYDDRADDSEMIANVIKHREGRPGEKIELVWDGPTTSIKQSRTRIALD
jgi:hypothetical protein